MNVARNDFETDLNICTSITFGGKVLNVYKVSNITYFHWKLLHFFYLKYKTELDPEHLPTSEMEIFMTKAICHKKGFWIHPQAAATKISKTQKTKKNQQRQQNLFLRRKMFFSVV